MNINLPPQSSPSVPGGHKHLLLFVSHDPPFLHAGLHVIIACSKNRILILIATGYTHFKPLKNSTLVLQSWSKKPVAIISNIHRIVMLYQIITYP